MMEGKKKILIITDNSAPIRNMAETIAAVMGNPPFADYSAVILDAESFSATDLLPVKVLLLGCEKPEAFSFLYIKDFFAHISLAGRSCGIFSSDTKAIKYLSTFVRDSDVTICKPLMAKDGAIDSQELHNWVQCVIQQGEKNECVQSR